MREYLLPRTRKYKKSEFGPAEQEEEEEEEETDGWRIENIPFEGAKYVKTHWLELNREKLGESQKKKSFVPAVLAFPLICFSLALLQTNGFCSLQFLH